MGALAHSLSVALSYYSVITLVVWVILLVHIARSPEARALLNVTAAQAMFASWWAAICWPVLVFSLARDDGPWRG